MDFGLLDVIRGCLITAEAYITVHGEGITMLERRRTATSLCEMWESPSKMRDVGAWRSTIRRLKGRSTPIWPLSSVSRCERHNPTRQFFFPLLGRNMLAAM